MRQWHAAVPPDLRTEWPFDFETYRCVCLVFAEMRWALGGMDAERTWIARMEVSVRYGTVRVPG